MGETFLPLSRGGIPAGVVLSLLSLDFKDLLSMFVRVMFCFVCFQLASLLCREGVKFCCSQFVFERCSLVISPSLFVQTTERTYARLKENPVLRTSPYSQSASQSDINSPATFQFSMDTEVHGCTFALELYRTWRGSTERALCTTRLSTQSQSCWDTALHRTCKT